jgi:hypothetical protein
MKKSMMDSHNDTYLEVSLVHVPTNIFTLVIVLTIYYIILGSPWTSSCYIIVDWSDGVGSCMDSPLLVYMYKSLNRLIFQVVRI